jgi:hypothetical protein
MPWNPYIVTLVGIWRAFSLVCFQVCTCAFYCATWCAFGVIFIIYPCLTCRGMTFCKTKIVNKKYQIQCKNKHVQYLWKFTLSYLMGVLFGVLSDNSSGVPFSVLTGKHTGCTWYMSDLWFGLISGNSSGVSFSVGICMDWVGCLLCSSWCAFWCCLSVCPFSSFWFYLA